MNQIERLVAILENLVEEADIHPDMEPYDYGYYRGLQKALDQAYAIADGAK